MKSFSQGRSFFGLLTSSMLVLTSHALFATVSVTSDTDNGSGAPGTLSAAINSVNATPSNGPISIEPDSLSITGPMPSITTSLSIEPSTSSGSCSITATASSYNLTTIAGTTTLTPGVALGTGFVVDSGATLLLQGPNNWISTTEGFTLNNATLEFAYIYDQPVYQVYAGPIAISGASTISIPHSQDTTHASILMTGVISGNGPLTFEGQSFGLQSSGQNTWSGGTILNNGYIMVFTSQSLPSGTNITLEGTGTLSFSLSNTATYSGGSINATRSSTCGVEFNGGTCTFTSLSNIFSVLQSAGSVTVLGSTSVNNYLVTGGVLTLSGDLGGPGNLSVFGGLVILEGANNDFSGQLDLGGGTLQLNTLSSFGGAKLNLGGGIFYLNAPGNLWTSACGFSGSTTIQTASGSTLAFPALEIASFEASSTLAITGSGTVAIDAFSFSPQFVTSSDTYQSVNLTVDGVLGGTGGLSLTNTDTNSGATFTLILSDVNTYSGATSVGNGCALEVSSGASFGTSSDDVTIAAGASLTNSGNIGADTFTNSGSVTVNSGSNITVATLFKNEGRGTVSGCGTITGNYNT
ncbi:MAG: hypothetical protein FJZ58_00005, partial [Chlamydiae bacterium]|nr:hypothetical protein [Chlamydiota bacterium]